MRNFLEETRKDIKDSGHTPDDIIFIGSTDTSVCYETTWEEFQALADFEYDDGFGAAYVPGDLRIVFADGADLHRGEYDGSEWWEYSILFVRPERTKPIRVLKSDKLWPRLADIQSDVETAI